MSDIYPSSTRYGRRATYFAKVGTHSGTLIVVYLTRKFEVGKVIKFATLDRVNGCRAGYVPENCWQRGLIEKIEGDRLFLSLF